SFASERTTPMSAFDPKRTFDSEDCYRARRARRRRRRSARNRRSTLPGLTQLSEERLHVLRQRLRLLHRGEMAAAGEDGPAAQIHERLLGDRARWTHHFLGEGGVADRGRRRPLDRHGPTPPLAEIIGIERRANRAGEPVETNIREHLIARQRPLDVAVAIRPGAEFLDDPGGEAGGRVVEGEAQRLRLRALNPLIAGLFVEPALELVKEGFLLGVGGWLP